MTTPQPENPSEAPSWVERHPAIALTVVLVAVLGTLDVAAGVVFRLAAGYPYFIRPERIAWAHYVEREQLYRVPNDLYDHDLAPLKSVEDVTWGPVSYRLQTNSLGFKDSSTRTVPLDVDGPRVLFIGDSFTEGVGYSYDETFVGLIDSALARDGVDVLNAAAVSYSPSIYARKVEYLLEDVGLELDEVIVFIDISDAQDEAQGYRRLSDGRVVARSASRAFGPPAPVAPREPGLFGSIKAAMRENTIVLASILQLKARIASTGDAGGNYPVNNERSMWTIDSTAYEEYGREGVALMEASMTRLHELLVRHDADLTVAVYPWPDQVAARDLDSRQVRIWRRWSEARGVRFVNLFPAFIAGEANADPLTTLRRYYISGDFHWNRAGHRLVARTFLQQYTPPVHAEPAGAADR